MNKFGIGIINLVFSLPIILYVARNVNKNKYSPDKIFTAFRSDGQTYRHGTTNRLLNVISSLLNRTSLTVRNKLCITAGSGVRPIETEIRNAIQFRDVHNKHPFIALINNSMCNNPFNLSPTSGRCKINS